MFSKILLSVFLLIGSGQILIDKIAAVINEEIITLTDIDKALSLYPIFRQPGEEESVYYRRILQELINYKVLYLEFRDQVQITERDFEEIQTPILGKAGSLESLNRILDQFDMNWQDFKDFIKERVLYEKVLKERLQRQINVTYSQIEEFYKSDYLPLQESLKLPIRTLIDMVPLIEKHLMKTRAENELSDWLTNIKSSYRIDNKLEKGRL